MLNSGKRKTEGRIDTRIENPDNAKAHLHERALRLGEFLGRWQAAKERTD
jgi:hypothetical protein